MSTSVHAFLAALLLLAPSRAGELLVAAASDLSPLEWDLRAALARVGVPVRFSFGSSVNLGQQIARGAPFDVFLSADEEQIRKGLREGWLLAGSDAQYANGRIALWSTAGTIQKVEQLADRSIRHIAIANPQFAPYGRAGKQALERSGIWQQVESRLVFGENIRQTFIYAERGSAEAAIVSWSLVFDRGGALVPATLHDPIRQSGAVVKDSKRQADARKVLDFLTGPEGQRILKAHGLFAPGKT